MPDATTLAVFVAAALALTLSPGPAVLYVVARGVEGGRPAGLVSALGICAGGLVHVSFAAVGLSAILASSATAFSVLKWLGVAYLVWLGLSRLLGGNGDPETPEAAATARSFRSVFWQGALLDMLNPKVALLFLAFLPQFVNPAGGPAWLQLLLLGLVFATVGLLTDSLYALLSGAAGDRMRRGSGGARFRRMGRYLSGCAYLALGLAAAVTGRGKD